ncbi:MAG: amidase, partial [Alphaproteobacteria bacterium]|nr:amidase [Alphaproteobacteria bacterium]
MKSLVTISHDISSQQINSATLIGAALDAIARPTGEGARAFTRVYRDAARAQAESADRMRAHGIVASPLAGLPISIKDLFDVAGEPTTAGSIVLKDAPPATRDAAIVARLRAAGAIIVGKTNMTEFAYSGIGWNPHYGTPRNPWDRGATPADGRIPGGSSSGAAISVTDDMAAAAIGTDTGGSVRIPAALCGLVGFKPTAARVPLTGSVPLSTSLDSIGPLARTVSCCALVDAVLAGIEPTVPVPLPLAGARLGVVKRYVLDGMDAHVARSYERALSRLSA